MEEKMSDSEFLGDTQNLIRPEREFNPQLGYDLVRSQLIDRLQNSISIKVTPEKEILLVSKFAI